MVQKNKEKELEFQKQNFEQEKHSVKEKNINSKLSEIKSTSDEKEIKLNQDIQKIKSVFTPQILEKNTEMADEFKNLDKE
jgi:hypothetical protein